MLNERGDVVASSASSQPGHYTDRELLQIHAREPGDRLLIGKPVLSSATGRWGMQMTRRITKADGSFGGIVLMSVDPAYFTDFTGSPIWAITMSRC